MRNESTTIKISRKTKDRLDKLRVYKRESYDEILQRALNLLNICRVNPEGAQEKLIAIEKRMRQDKILSGDKKAAY